MATPPPEVVFTPSEVATTPPEFATPPPEVVTPSPLIPICYRYIGIAALVVIIGVGLAYLLRYRVPRNK